jgi:hypothetical protein
MLCVIYQNISHDVHAHFLCKIKQALTESIKLGFIQHNRWFQRNFFFKGLESMASIFHLIWHLPKDNTNAIKYFPILFYTDVETHWIDSHLVTDPILTAVFYLQVCKDNLHPPSAGKQLLMCNVTRKTMTMKKVWRCSQKHALTCPQRKYMDDDQN